MGMYTELVMACEIKNDIEEMLHTYQIPYDECTGNQEGYDLIYADIMSRHKVLKVVKNA